jgi:hypothetical protein
MTLDLQQAHALLDGLPLAKVGVVRSLLAVMVGDGEPSRRKTVAAFTKGKRGSLNGAARGFQ